MLNTTTSSRRPSRWLPAAAAAAAVILGGVAGAAILTDVDPAPTSAQRSTLELALPDSGVMSSCIMYSVDVLAEMPTAFSGTVLEADDDSVVLDVVRWYRGGDADSVELVNESGPMTSIDGVEFSQGDRYLLTASEAGKVNSCGYTAEWSPAMAADFEDAFGE